MIILAQNSSNLQIKTFVSGLAMPRSKKIGAACANTRRNPSNLATLKSTRSGNVLLALRSGHKFTIARQRIAEQTAQDSTFDPHIRIQERTPRGGKRNDSDGTPLRTGEQRTEAADGDPAAGGEELLEVGLVVEFAQFEREPVGAVAGHGDRRRPAEDPAAIGAA